MPPGVALGLGCAATVALALVFPYSSLEEQLERNPRQADALQIAYLQAWLNVRPDRSQLRYLFARQLVSADRLDAARVQLRTLSGLRNSPQRSRAVLLELDIASAEINRLDVSDPKRGELQRALHSRFDELAAQPDAGLQPIEADLAQRAAESGARAAATLWYRRLLERNAQLPAAVWEHAAKTALAVGEPQWAARLFSAAVEASAVRADQRRNFLAALRALQAHGLLAEALELAERYLGELATDTTTLEFLTRLALAANRPDIAQRYAQLLIKLSLLPWAVAIVQARGGAVPAAWLELLERTQGARPMPAQAELPAKPEMSFDPSRTPHLPYDERLYTLSYDVFIANSNLRDAMAVAQAAVRHLPRSRTWRLRLAQAADWAGQPQLALEQWHAIARAEGDPKAWAEVLRRAPQVFDAARWVDALRFDHSRKRSDFAQEQTIVSAYEQLGEPGRAIEFLQGLVKATAPGSGGAAGSELRRRRLELLVDLGIRAGRDDVRRSALEALTRELGPRPSYALGLASLAVARGDMAAAFAVLAAAAKRGVPAVDAAVADEFWGAYAELARLTGRLEEAATVYLRLIATGGAGEGEFSHGASLLEATAPLEAARIYEEAYLRFQKPYMVLQALSLLRQHGSVGDVRAFLARLAARLTAEQLAALEVDHNFLMQRASFYLSVNEPRHAAQDARRALRLAPNYFESRALLVWILIAGRAAGELRALLEDSAAVARTDPQLWGPCAAGWLSLHEPRRALFYLRKQVRADDDLLWSFGYADALEQLGYADAAWQLRRRAWLRLREQPRAPGAAGPRPADSPSNAPAEGADERRHRLLSLALMFDTGDGARARLLELMRTDPTVNTGSGRDAVLSYWIGREASEVAKAWLLTRYLDALSRPAWAELSIALAENDGTRLEYLLDNIADWLPIYDRVEAAQRIGRPAQAQTLAFDALERLPDNDSLHQRLLDRALATPSFVGAGFGRFSQQPLAETRYSAEAATPMSQHLLLHAQWENVARRSTDEQILVDPPAHDRTAQLGLRYAAGGDDLLVLSLQQRRGLDTETGIRAEGQWQLAPRLRLSAAAGSAQPATDSVILRVGAVRDVLEAGLQTAISNRQFASVSATESRFSAQGGGRIGSSSTLRAELGHRFRTEYPDLSLRLIYTDLNYRAKGGVETKLLPLLPAVQQPAADNASFVPQSTSQWSVLLVCGETAREQYSRAWRPYCAAGWTEDRRSGSSYEWQLGARGSVLGTDQLWLTWAGGSARGLTRTSYLDWAVRYRWFY